MKRCPECRRDYYDDTLAYCLDDGAALVYGASSENIMADRTEMLPTISDQLPGLLPTISGHLPGMLTDELPRSRRLARRTAIVGALALVVIAAALALAYSYFKPRGTRISSVAVMPLQSLKNDENTRALGLGLTDALITKLGGLRQVIVRPTSAIMSVAPATSSTEVGQRLNVDAVLEGTIQEADGRLRVNARLIRTSTGEQIWSESFEQPATNLFAIQDAMSSSIAKALTFELSKSDSERLVRRGTNNNEAYEKYLRGRFYQTQNTPDGLERSIEFYEQAVALDSSFAEAWAGIADAHLILFNLGFRSAEETIPQARIALDRALRLNSDLSSTHTSNALIQFLIDRNWPEAEKSLQRAIELNPNNADAFLRYGYFLINVGRFDDALEKLHKAREFNPLSPISQTNVGMAYLFSRRYPEAIEQLERTARDHPKFSLSRWLLGLAYEASGDPERAFEENVKALEIDGGTALAAELKRVKDVQGVEAANRFWFAQSAEGKTTGTMPFEKQKQPVRLTGMVVATQAATIKDREQTLHWLERSSEEGDPTLFQIKYLTKFDFVRGDARFRAIVEKLNF
jgi:TolB-like protein